MEDKEAMESLKKVLACLGAENDDKTIEKFRCYMEGVLYWNEKVNLTAITNRKEFVIKHFIDSLICIDYPEFEDAHRIIDVGTGAGFPGIPLALAAPQKELVLMDSLNKRLKIIEELCQEAGIANVTTVHARAEELARNTNYRERYDLCVSRAVANMAVLAEYCLPFIKPGGYLFAYKGSEAEAEVRQASGAISLLGGKAEEIREGNLREFGIDHKVVVIKKVSNTPSKYPRKPGTPTKEPLK